MTSDIKPDLTRPADVSTKPQNDDTAEALCGDCPPLGYSTDITRCEPCPRRGEKEPARVHKPDVCEWVIDEDTSSFDASCGGKWCQIEGGCSPIEEGHNFCGTCGKPIKFMAGGPETGNGWPLVEGSDKAKSETPAATIPLVQRLREYGGTLAPEAADEIERLTAALAPEQDK